MTVALAFVILLLAIALIILVLIQESKGGGLVSTIGGVGKAAEFFGMRRATEDVEKITWGVAIAIAVLSFVMNISLSSGGGETQKNRMKLRLQEGLKNTQIVAPTSQSQLKLPTEPQGTPSNKSQ